MANQELQNKGERVRTLTRKDVEEKMEFKLSGKKVTKKLIVDSLFDSLRELLMSANPIIKNRNQRFRCIRSEKDTSETESQKSKNRRICICSGQKKNAFQTR